MDNTLTIQEAADRTGLSTHTLRYYERVGLIESVGRAPSGHRAYSEADLGWLRFVKCLRSTGMPIREIKRYAELYAEGDTTVNERLALLETHRARIRANLDELTQNLEALEYKIAYYRQIEDTYTQPAIAEAQGD